MNFFFIKYFFLKKIKSTQLKKYSPYKKQNTFKNNLFYKNKLNNRGLLITKKFIKKL